MGRFHATALAHSAAVDVIAVAEPAADSVAAAGNSIDAATVYPTAEEAFAHPGVEGCLIASPTPSHPALVRSAFAAGLHVLCEKPLSLDPAESRDLETERDGLILQVGFWRRFSPPWRAAANAIRAGRIGRPLLVRLSQWDADPPPPAFCDPAVSGGIAIDCGVHEFDLAEWLTGLTVETVQAWNLPTVDPEVAAAGDVDNLVVALRLEGGALATVDLSRNSRYGDDVRTEILGSDGAILIDLLPTGRARIGAASGMEILAGSETDDATAAGVIGQMEAFAAAVRGAGPELPDAAASARATEIAIAATVAAAGGDVISVAP